MTDPFQAVSVIVGAIKKALEVSKGLKDADMQAVLLDAQERVLDLKEEVLNLRNENAALRELLDDKNTLKFDRGAYWSEVDGSRDGPFCARCWDADKKRLRLHPTGFGGYSYTCPECQKKFTVESAPKMPPLPPMSLR